MSTLSQFGGNRATTQIINAHSSGGTSAVSLQASSTTNMAREVLSGALTAGTLSTVVSITGGGLIPYLTAYSKNATSRTIRLVVILDGVTVFDATSSAVAANNAGIAAVAAATSSSYLVPTTPIRFNASCVIRVASSLTETDLVGVAYSLV